MNRIIDIIAAKNGVTAESVEKEISLAIMEGMKNRNSTKSSQQFWDKLSPNGEVPTVEAFLESIQKRMQ